MGRENNNRKPLRKNDKLAEVQVNVIDAPVVNMTQLQVLTGKSLNVVKQRLGAAGLAPIARKGRAIKYDSRDALKAIYMADAMQLVKTDMASRANLEEERIREVKERADNLELKNAQLRRELAPVNALKWLVGKICANLSSGLDSLPVKLKRRVATLSATDIDLIKAEIAKLQNYLAEMEVSFDEYDGG